jgi:hypothetical protein
MSQHDPSAPGPRHSQGWSTGAHPRSAHGEPGARPPEVPEPASVPDDWSPSGAYAGHHTSGYSGDPGGAPVAWLSTPKEPGGGPVAWDQHGTASGWSGRHPEPDPAASWNGNTTMSGAYRGSHADAEPTAWNGSPVPDRIPAEWNDAHVPDAVPQSWNSEPPTASWHAMPTSWNGSAPTAQPPTAQPPAAGWNAAPMSPPASAPVPARNGSPAPVDHGAASARTDEKVRRSPKLMLAAALVAAALAGGGVGAGLMAAFGGDSAATVPAAPDGGQIPGGQPPAGQAPDGAAPTATASKASN